VAAYLPWSWTIKPFVSSNITYSHVSSVLGTFAVVNAVVGLLNILLSHRLIAKKLACGLFGRRERKLWKFLWALPTGLQLGLNAIIAAVIKRTPGYDTHWPKILSTETLHGGSNMDATLSGWVHNRDGRVTIDWRC
jgi:hypothetical protein